MYKNILLSFVVICFLLASSTSAVTITYLFGDKDGFNTSTAAIPDGTPFSSGIISSLVPENDDHLGTDTLMFGTNNEITIPLLFDSFSSISSITLLLATANIADSGPSGSGLFVNDFLTIDGIDVNGAFDGINQDSPDVTGTIVFDSQQGSPVLNTHSGTFPLATSLFPLFADGQINLRPELSGNDGIAIDFIELTITGNMVPETSSWSLLLIGMVMLAYRRN